MSETNTCNQHLSTAQPSLVVSHFQSSTTTTNMSSATQKLQQNPYVQQAQTKASVYINQLDKEVSSVFRYSPRSQTDTGLAHEIPRAQQPRATHPGPQGIRCHWRSLLHCRPPQLQCTRRPRLKSRRMGSSRIPFIQGHRVSLGAR